MTSVDVNIEKDNSATVNQIEREYYTGDTKFLSFVIPLLVFISAIVFLNHYDMQQPAPKLYSTSPEPLGVAFFHATSVFGGFIYLVMLFLAFGGSINMRKVGQEVTTYSNGKVIVTDIKERISDLEIKRDTVAGKGISVALKGGTITACIPVTYVVTSESLGLGVSYVNLGFFMSLGAIVATVFFSAAAGLIFSSICGMINENTKKVEEYTTEYGTLGTTIQRTFFWLVSGVVLHKFLPATYNLILGFFS
ncbi:hypothetical protein BCU66_003715 [Vibrio sp. 10N.286.49.B1]|uniref:hypothetical protein n=1 Tax=unclassified Vibrio TaxID=2614977 RepID=UPI001055F535|nr:MULTISPECIES: hypothetical protein [unclassified Vibrio]